MKKIIAIVTVLLSFSVAAQVDTDANASPQMPSDQVVVPAGIPNNTDKNTQAPANDMDQTDGVGGGDSADTMNDPDPESDVNSANSALPAQAS